MANPNLKLIKYFCFNDLELHLYLNLQVEHPSGHSTCLKRRKMYCDLDSEIEC